MVNYKTGLVLNTRGDGFFNKTIQMGMGNYWSHTLWIREVKGDKVFVQEALVAKKYKCVKSTWYKKSYFDDLYARNRLKVMDFGIIDNKIFVNCCNQYEGLEYDYYSIYRIFLARFSVVFGINSENIIRYNKNNDSTDKKLDCSETIARGLNSILNINVLQILNVSKYDLVTPQMISILFDKIKNGK